MNKTVVLGGDCQLIQVIDGDLALKQSYCGEGDLVILKNEVPYPAYTGEVEITPSESVQVLSTDHTTLYSNITIDSIPSNYGLLSWDGSVLTVS